MLSLYEMGVPKGWRRLLTDPEALGVTNSESKPNQVRPFVINFNPHKKNILI